MENNLTQLTCPNCGANINILDITQIEIECPYCHQIVLNKFAIREQKEEEKYVMLPIATEKDFYSNFINNLANTDHVPLDVFDRMAVKNKRLEYQPFYLLSFSFESYWNATLSHDEPYEVMVQTKEGLKTKTKYRKIYRSVNGTAAGSEAQYFEANYRMKSPSDLVSYVYNEKIYTTYDARKKFKNLPTSFQNPKYSVDERISDIETYIRQVADVTAEESVQQQLTYNESIQNVSNSPKFHIDDAKLVYIPVWCMEYEYGENSYTCRMEAISSNIMMTNPEDEEEKERIDKLESEKYNNQGCIGITITVIGIILGIWLSSWIVVAIGIGVAITAVVIINNHDNPLEQEIQNMMTNSHDLRDEAAQRYLAGDMSFDRISERQAESRQRMTKLFEESNAVSPSGLTRDETIDDSGNDEELEKASSQEESPIVCPNCGANVKENYKYCIKCGCTIKK